VAKHLPNYRGGALRRDVLAAFTVAALAIPAAMAYAEVAGLSPVTGLYALLLPAVAYALLGSSRQLIVGPEGSLSALVAASVLGLATAGSAHAGELAAMLALLVAACFVLARILRIGWVADYLSRPVLIGYIHGVAVVLVIGQLGKLLGLSVSAREPLAQLAEVARELGSTSLSTLAVGAAALAVLIPLRFIAPRAPAALITVIAAIVASAALGLADEGVAVVGEIPSGLPRPQVPTPTGDEIAALLPAAAGLFLVSFADEILTARSFAGRHGQHIGVGQELVAMGAANAAAGFTQGLVVGASGSRTAVNDSMGARSQISGLLAAGVVALVLLFLTAPIADLPKAVLGAVIIAACVGLVDPAAWRALRASDRVELAIAAITTAGVVIAGVLPAIGVAVALSIIDVVRRSARPHDAVLGWVPRLGRWADVAVHPSARVTPGVVVYRLDDRLFFANAGYVKGRVREALRAAPSPAHALVFDAEGLAQIDTAGIDALTDLATNLGVELHFARAKSPVAARLEALAVPFHPTVRQAVEAIVQRG
jgi:high affinity sulfate transporter 1